jgi:predicted membrane protein
VHYDEHPRMLIASLIAGLLLAFVHIWGVRLTFSPAIPRSHWLSMAGGTAVAFVFVHIIPELARGQEHITESGQAPADFLDQHTYILALIGLIAFYGLEHLVKVRHPGETKESPRLSHHIFWVHIGSFAFYNAIIGYLLIHRDVPGLSVLAAFTLAMMLHFVVNDHALREHHKDDYHDVGRWLLAGSVLAGWLAGLLIEVSDAVVSMLFAFVAGAIVLNVLKEELPDERESKFWAFALGAAAYSILFVIVE